MAFIDENGKVTDKPLYFFLERYMQSFTDEMTEFIDCVLHDKPTKTTVEDGLQALRMGLAAKVAGRAPPGKAKRDQSIISI